MLSSSSNESMQPPTSPEQGSLPADFDAGGLWSLLQDITHQSPEFSPDNMFADATPALDYLTSPMSGDVGVMEELMTPTNAADDLSALLAFEFDGAPLFGGCPTDESYASVEKAAPPLLTVSPHEHLYTMSPHSPYINPSALTSPATMPIHDITPPANGAAAGSSRSTSVIKKKGPTGTRKNITPAALISEDAPVQSRTYVLPSATSRKALPQTFARKRSRTAAFGADDDDELDDDGPAPTNAEEAAIAAKRRQNTLAARRSRKRKLEYQQELETALEEEKRQTEKWKGRAESMRAILYSTGTPFPAWTD